MIADFETVLSAQNVDHLVAVVVEVGRRFGADRGYFLERHDTLPSLTPSKESLEIETAWRSGLDSNFRYQLVDGYDGLPTAHKVALEFEFALLCHLVEKSFNGGYGLRTRPVTPAAAVTSNEPTGSRLRIHVDSELFCANTISQRVGKSCVVCRFGDRQLLHASVHQDGRVEPQPRGQTYEEFGSSNGGGLVIALLPSLGWAQETDRGEMDQWLKASEHQGDIPVGTKITMANWQQYKQFMPVGMIKMWEGKYFWKMPPEAEIDIGPTHTGYVSKQWREATERYGAQTQVEVLPNGHFVLKNYHGGTPFPNPQEPNKGWKILTNVFFSYTPALYVHTPNNDGTIWSLDRFGNVNAVTLDVVYRRSAYNTDPGFPETDNYAPGTWYTEWLMEESPEQAHYTASLNLFYIDQEKTPFPDTYVFVPALRRSLRLASTARCSPVFGWEWTYDDAKFNGFNGSTSIYTGEFLGDRKVLALSVADWAQGANFPANYYPLGFPTPSWGKWEARDTAIDDVHRIASEAAGYCYTSRMMYTDRELWLSSWVDLYDSSRKLWKSIVYYNSVGDVPGIGHAWNEIPSSTAWDFQNAHATVWSSFGNPSKIGAYLDLQAPKEYQDGIKAARAV